MSQAYMLKHNVDTESMHRDLPPFAFRLYCIFERFTDLLFSERVYAHA